MIATARRVLAQLGASALPLPAVAQLSRAPAAAQLRPALASVVGIDDMRC